MTPLVLRILDVPATAIVAELHELLQAGLGWTDSHLHEFQTPAQDNPNATGAGLGPATASPTPTSRTPTSPSWSATAYTPRPARREDDLPPLAALHDVLRHVGLLRLLAPTRAATDPTHTIRRIRSWFGPDDGFLAMLAGTVVALLDHHRPTALAVLARRAHPLLDRWVHPDGTPLSPADVRLEISRLAALAQGLDLLRIHDSLWAPGPAARTLLPRATALAHLWTLPLYRPDPDTALDPDQRQLDPPPSARDRT